MILVCIGNYAMYGQDNIQVKEQSVSSGFVLELSRDQITTESNYLFLMDSSNQKFNLGEISIASQNIWTKQSNSRIDRPNVVHWYFDENTGLLQIDFSNVKNLISSGTKIEITVLAVGSRKRHHNLVLFESSSDFSSPQNLKKINEIEINLK